MDLIDVYNSIKKIVRYYVILLCILLLDITGVILYKSTTLNHEVASLLSYILRINSEYNLTSAIGKFLIYFTLAIIIYSGLFHLCKNAIIEKELNVETFIEGVKKNWFKTLKLILIMSIIFYVLQGIVDMFYYLGIFVGMYLHYLLFIIKAIIFVFIGYQVVEEELGAKEFLFKFREFLFSKRFAKQLLLFLVLNLIMTFIAYRVEMQIFETYLKRIDEVSLFNDNSILNLINILPSFTLPNWFYLLSSIVKSLLMTFVIFFNGISIYKRVY